MQPIERARCSLEGLSVGDAFGECYFVYTDRLESFIGRRILASDPWLYTDDTEMALSIYSVLRRYARIDQDHLALSFAHHVGNARGYGAGTYRLQRSVREGRAWREEARDAFEGQGSCGNGAAMRVAPLGAYFAEDLEAVVESPRLSAEVTHTHPEGIAGAIAVAVAAA